MISHDQECSKAPKMEISYDPNVFSQPSEVIKSEDESVKTIKRRELCKTCKDIIISVHRHCVVTNPVAPITDASKIVGVPRTTVGLIVKGPTTPKQHKNTRIALSKIDDFECDVLRRAVYGFYADKKAPSLDVLLESLQANTDFPYKRTTLRNVLFKLGFKYKTLNKRKVLLESMKYQVWRYNYITTLRMARRKGRNVVYLDETWYDNNTIKKGWADCGCTCDLDVPSSRPKSVIIINAGSKDGWVENALHLSAKKDGTDRSEMNCALFEKWFEEQLLDNLPENSVIVMDNATYHSRLSLKLPTITTSKSDIVTFMNAHGIPIPDPLPIKTVLLDIVNTAGIEKKYIVDELAKSKGYEVVRLPPYHCIFNPIQQVWSKVKEDVRTSSTDPASDPALYQILRVMNKVTPEMWKGYVDQAIEKEDLYLSMDLQHDGVESIIANTMDGDDDFDSSSDEE